MSNEIPLSAWTRGIKPSSIQQMLSLSSSSEVISFALGLPSESLFPMEAYREAVVSVLNTSPICLQYSPPLQLLKEQIVELMKARKVECKVEQVFLTSGAQQGMSMLSRLLLDPYTNVIVDEVTYSGFTQAVEPFQPNLLTLPVNCHTDVSLNTLESYCKQKHPPQLMYMVTEGHNPLGISMPQEKRLRLAEIASTYNIPIIEDDTYGFLNYQETLPPIKAYCNKWVFYIGSFSKIFAPSLRVGWIVAPEKIIEKLEILKEGTDINTATFAQRTLLAFIEKGHLTTHLKKIQQAYKEKRDAAVASLNKYLPELEYSIPECGFFIWGRLPGRIDTTKLFWNAFKNEKVTFLPGSAFSLGEKVYFNNCLRLSFSHCPLEMIEEGIKRLARAIHKFNPLEMDYLPEAVGQ